MTKLVHKKTPRIDDVLWKPWLGGFADRPIAAPLDWNAPDGEIAKMVSPTRPKRRKRHRQKKRRGGKSTSQTRLFPYEAKMAPSRTHPNGHSRWYRTIAAASASSKSSWGSYRERTRNSGNGPQEDVGAPK